MVLVVVFVHSVAADEKEILKPIDIVTNNIEPVVAAEIGRISLWDTNDMRIHHVFSVNNSDLIDFADRKSVISSSDSFQMGSVSLQKYSRPSHTLSGLSVAMDSSC